MLKPKRNGEGRNSMGETKKAFEEAIPGINRNNRAIDLMEAFPRVIQFDLDGEEGKIYLVVKKGKMALAEKISGEPDIIVSGETGPFAKVIKGGIDVTHPIARGQLTVKKGKISEMTLLNRILWIK